MTVFRFKVIGENPAHVRVNLYTGPDPDHLGLAGGLTFRADEFPAFADAITEYNERMDGCEERTEWGIQHFGGTIGAVAVRPGRIYSPNIHLWRRAVRTWPDGSSWTGPWSRCADQEAEVAR